MKFQCFFIIFAFIPLINAQTCSLVKENEDPASVNLAGATFTTCGTFSSTSDANIDINWSEPRVNDVTIFYQESSAALSWKSLSATDVDPSLSLTFTLKNGIENTIQGDATFTNTNLSLESGTKLKFADPSSTLTGTSGSIFTIDSEGSNLGVNNSPTNSLTVLLDGESSLNLGSSGDQTEIETNLDDIRISCSTSQSATCLNMYTPKISSTGLTLKLENNNEWVAEQSAESTTSYLNFDELDLTLNSGSIATLSSSSSAHESSFSLVGSTSSISLNEGSSLSLANYKTANMQGSSLSLSGSSSMIFNGGLVGTYSFDDSHVLDQSSMQLHGTSVVQLSSPTMDLKNSTIIASASSSLTFVNTTINLSDGSEISCDDSCSVSLMNSNITSASPPSLGSAITLKRLEAHSSDITSNYTIIEDQFLLSEGSSFKASGPIIFSNVVVIVKDDSVSNFDNDDFIFKSGGTSNGNNAAFFDEGDFIFSSSIVPPGSGGSGPYPSTTVFFDRSTIDIDSTSSMLSRDVTIDIYNSTFVGNHVLDSCNGTIRSSSSFESSSLRNTSLAIADINSALTLSQDIKLDANSTLRDCDGCSTPLTFASLNLTVGDGSSVFLGGSTITAFDDVSIEASGSNSYVLLTSSTFDSGIFFPGGSDSTLPVNMPASLKRDNKITLQTDTGDIYLKSSRRLGLKTGSEFGKGTFNGSYNLKGSTFDITAPPGEELDVSIVGAILFNLDTSISSNDTTNFLIQSSEIRGGSMNLNLASGSMGWDDMLTKGGRVRLGPSIQSGTGANSKIDIFIGSWWLNSSSIVTIDHVNTTTDDNIEIKLLEGSSLTIGSQPAVVPDGSDGFNFFELGVGSNITVDDSAAIATFGVSSTQLSIRSSSARESGIFTHATTVGGGLDLRVKVKYPWLVDYDEDDGFYSILVDVEGSTGTSAFESVRILNANVSLINSDSAAVQAGTTTNLHHNDRNCFFLRSGFNMDGYGEGWLYKTAISDSSEISISNTLLTRIEDVSLSDTSTLTTRPSSSTSSVLSVSGSNTVSTGSSWSTPVTGEELETLIEIQAGTSIIVEDASSLVEMEVNNRTTVTIGTGSSLSGTGSGGGGGSRNFKFTGKNNELSSATGKASVDVTGFGSGNIKGSFNSITIQGSGSIQHAEIAEIFVNVTLQDGFVFDDSDFVNTTLWTSVNSGSTTTHPYRHELSNGVLTVNVCHFRGVGVVGGGGTGKPTCAYDFTFETASDDYCPSYVFGGDSDVSGAASTVSFLNTSLVIDGGSLLSLDEAAINVESSDIELGRTGSATSSNCGFGAGLSTDPAQLGTVFTDSTLRTFGEIGGCRVRGIAFEGESSLVFRGSSGPEGGAMMGEMLSFRGSRSTFYIHTSSSIGGSLVTGASGIEIDSNLDDMKASLVLQNDAQVETPKITVKGKEATLGFAAGSRSRSFARLTGTNPSSSTNITLSDGASISFRALVDVTNGRVQEDAPIDQLTSCSTATFNDLTVEDEGSSIRVGILPDGSVCGGLRATRLVLEQDLDISISVSDSTDIPEEISIIEADSVEGDGSLSFTIEGLEEGVSCEPTVEDDGVTITTNCSSGSLFPFNPFITLGVLAALLAIGVIWFCKTGSSASSSTPKSTKSESSAV